MNATNMRKCLINSQCLTDYRARMSSKIFASYVIVVCCLVVECARVKRIVGGHDVPCGAYKYVASLRNALLQQICGAIIISPNFALTAAHCVRNTSDGYHLSLNNYCIGPDDNYPQAQVLDVITHPQYDKASAAHDISVLRIDHDLSDVSWLNDVLPSSSFGIAGECSIYGYGYKDVTTQKTSETLVAARVTILSLDRCIQLLGEYVAPGPDSGMICAIGGSSDACQGDSGGPMMCGSKLQGISSYGVGCGLRGMPGVYVSIGPHLHWIRNVTNIS